MNYTYKDIVKKIRKLGYVLDRQAKGSHELRYHPHIYKHILLPKHNKKTLSKGVIKSIISTLHITNQEFQKL